MPQSSRFWSFALLFASGCGTAPTWQDADPEPDWLIASDGLCYVSSEQAWLTDIRIVAENGQVIAGVDLEEVSATVTIAGEAERDLASFVEVNGALAFSGEVDTGIGYTLRAAVQVGDGLVTLNPGATLGRAFVSDDGVHGIVELNDHARLEELQLPCEALSLAQDDPWWEDSFEEPGDGAIWISTQERCDFEIQNDFDWWNRYRSAELGEPEALEQDWDETYLDEDDEPSCFAELTVHSQPGFGSAVTILSEIPIEVEQLLSREGWMKVRAAFTRGTVIGWVRQTAVEQSDDGYGFGSGFGIGFGIGCGCGCAWGSLSLHPTYSGPAEVRVGTEVHATSEEPSRWATVQQVGPFTVQHTNGSEWVSLIGIPGINQNCRRFDEAMVRADAVELPGPDAYE